MGTLGSVTSIEVAGTKAKAAAFNNAMTEIFSVLNSGSREIYLNTYRNNRTSSSSMTWTGSDCAFFGYHTIDNGHTYHLATSTARGVCFGELALNSTGALTLALSLIHI